MDGKILDSLFIDFHISEFHCQMTTLTREHRAGNPYFRHRHSAFELHYISSGGAVFRIGTDSHDVAAGQMILIAPGVYHSIKETSKDISKMCLGFEVLTPPRGYQKQEALSMDRCFRAFDAVVLDAVSLEPLLSQIRCIPAESLSQFTTQEELKAMLSLLILGITRKLALHSPAARQQELVPTQRSQLIDEFFNRNFYLQDGDRQLANLLHVSCRQLDRILKELYGKSYREKLLEIRLEIAIDLLQTTQRRVTEISELTGYSNPANFSAFIRSATGRTPTAIRKEAQTLSKTHSS